MQSACESIARRSWVAVAYGAAGSTIKMAMTERRMIVSLPNNHACSVIALLSVSAVSARCHFAVHLSGPSYRNFRSTESICQCFVRCQYCMSSYCPESIRQCTHSHVSDVRMGWNVLNQVSFPLINGKQSFSAHI
jgi:hypothetical protein